VDLVDLSVMDLVWRHQTQACMMMRLIVPDEKRPAERLGIL
jgi:hypothetical protein